MHHGTYFGHPFRELVRLAELSECKDLTLGPAFARDLIESAAPKDVLQIAADSQVTITHLDPIICWLPTWQPDPKIGTLPAGVFDVPLDDVFRTIDALSIESISVLGTFPPGSVGLSEVIDHFGALCERAARHAVRCDIEFVPFFGISDLETAWSIIQHSRASNAAIMFDFWHYFRGKRDDALLRSIPGDRIGGVQFDDALMSTPLGRSAFEDTFAYRELPGHGEMPIREVTAILREIGALKNIGPEILSTKFWQLPVEKAAQLCREAMTWALR